VSVYFADSSALVKKYVLERGSNWIRTLTHPTSGDVIHVSRLARVEVISALVRRLRGTATAVSQTALLTASVRYDFDYLFDIVEPTRATLDESADLAERHWLRAYDAAHLATALRLSRRRLARSLAPLTLISADAELNAAAYAEGLSVEDPNNYP
jgi:uncharacterized protein